MAPERQSRVTTNHRRHKGSSPRDTPRDGPRRGHSSPPPSESSNPDQPNESDEDLNTDDEKPSKKRDSDLMVSKGRIFGRCVDMFRTIRSIIEEGTSRDPDGQHNASNLHTKEVNANYKAFQQLQVMVPTLNDEIAVRGLATVAARLEEGRRRGRTDDLSSVRKHIDTWYDWNPRFPKVDKSLAGFKHPQCGRLLCPIDLDWNDEDTREKLRDKKIVVTPDDLPCFLWAGNKQDAEDPFAGFLKSDFLVKTLLTILRGPSFASGGAKSTRQGNALKHGITRVSFPSICYGACILYHVLSSQQTWSNGTGASGDFKSKRFYKTLLNLIDTMEKDEKQELLTWWNEKIFIGVEDDVDSDSDNERSDCVLSAAEKMRAHAKAKRAQAARQPLTPAN